MFTGIITAVEKVQRVTRKGQSLEVNIAIPRGWKFKLGESVSVNGVCSTVASLEAKAFSVTYMPETLRKTTAAFWKMGEEVNLERSLALGDRVHGHLVQGHVDATGEILSVETQGESRVLHIGFPREYQKFIASKGSICVNGVSLTVVEVGQGEFQVALVEYTLAHTNLRKLAKGDAVNLEVDIIARYLHAKKK
ncbi:MAG: riboflavin synthase [Candidatus Liptonbacteria bacterium]|nr:riboflavin synthase [Candidatus Liptonbacteria bacterium]